MRDIRGELAEQRKALKELLDAGGQQQQQQRRSS